jgi:hypothetical protein
MGTSGLTAELKWYQFKHPNVTESTKIKQGKRHKGSELKESEA